MITCLISCNSKPESVNYVQTLKQEHEYFQYRVDSLKKVNTKLQKKNCLYQVKLFTEQNQWEMAHRALKDCEHILDRNTRNKLRKAIANNASNYKNNNLKYKEYFYLLGDWIPVYDTGLTTIDTALIDQYISAERYSYTKLPFARFNNERFNDLLEFGNIKVPRSSKYFLTYRPLKNNFTAIFILYFSRKWNYQSDIIILDRNQSIVDSKMILTKVSSDRPHEYDETRDYLDGLVFTSDSSFNIKKIKVELLAYSETTIDSAITSYQITDNGEIIKQNETGYNN